MYQNIYILLNINKYIIKIFFLDDTEFFNIEKFNKGGFFFS